MSVLAVVLARDKAKIDTADVDHWEVAQSFLSDDLTITFVMRSGERREVTVTATEMREATA